MSFLLNVWISQVSSASDVSRSVSLSAFLSLTFILKLLVFGGHATWIKAIKPLLTGCIRFIDKNKGFDNAIIRHADIVWIQPNALSHSQYYTIIDAVRQLKKPVRYFTYASALKCARQLCLADQEKGI